MIISYKDNNLLWPLKRDSEGPIHSMAKFTYNKDNKTFVCEASDLTCKKYAGRIWPDACDYGFWIQSHVTKTVMLFTHDLDDVRDGELCGQWFSSEEGFKAFVIND